jgi:hypothetical protein
LRVGCSVRVVFACSSEAQWFHVTTCWYQYGWRDK